MTVMPDLAAKFFKTLFAESEGYLVLWTLQNKLSCCVDSHDWKRAADKAQELAPTFDVYFGLGLQRDALPPDRRGVADGVIVLPGFWMDLDVKGPNHKGNVLPGNIVEAQQLAGWFPLKPTIVVHSGGGLQVYWLFKEPWTLDSDLERLQAKNLSKRFQATIIAEGKRHGWEMDDTSDLARVLRIPGTYNRKSTPVQVSVIDHHLERRYSPSDFEPYLLAERKRFDTAKALKGVPYGQRYRTLIALAGKLRYADLPLDAALDQMLKCAANCDPPAPEEDTKKILEKAYADWSPGADPESRKFAQAEKQSQADRLVKCAFDQGVELFHDQYRNPFAQVNREGVFETLPCKSSEFRRLLTSLLWRREHKSVGSESVRAASDTLAAQAIFDGNQHSLLNRLAFHEGAIYYDLADKQWRAVRIDPGAWEIVDKPPVLFRRYNHMAPQAEPRRGGNLRDLLRFTNLADSKQEVLFLVTLVSYLKPEIPHPVTIVHGPQGAAKTTMQRIMGRLVDPSRTETLALPTDKNEFIQQLSHHYAPVYDNVRFLHDWQSDGFCRAVTGEGHSKRELYSDDDDVIYAFRRCILMNGINVAAERPDLLARSILLGLESIPDDKRREEEDYWAEFETARPLLFGAMLDALAAAMDIVGSIKLLSLPRMADFARWGCAIAEALGYRHQEFLDAYSENAGRGHEEIIAGDLIAITIKTLMESVSSWEGAPHELLSALEPVALGCKIDVHSKAWPKAPNVLTRRLNEIAPTLRAVGIEVRRGRVTAGRRKISLHRLPENTATTATPPPPLLNPLTDHSLGDSGDSGDSFGDIGRPSAGCPSTAPEGESDWMAGPREFFQRKKEAGKKVTVTI